MGLWIEHYTSPPPGPWSWCWRGLCGPWLTWRYRSCRYARETVLISTAYVWKSTKTDASMLKNNVCPFLFIRGLSCQQCSDIINSKHLLTVSFGDIGFFLKNPMSSTGLEIRSESAFTTFRALLLSANYYSELSGQVWPLLLYSEGVTALCR